VYNVKGGVGKTAAAVNLAFLSTLSGERTLLWDLDPQAAATYLFRVRPEIAGGGRRLVAKKKRLPREIRGTDFEGLDLVPADFSYRHMDLDLEAAGKPTKRLARLLAPLEREYDHVVLDCPPSISVASESVFEAAGALLVPTIPTPLSLRALEQLAGHLSAQGIAVRLWPFFSMVDRRKRLHRELCAAAGPVPMLATAIPYAAEVELMALRRQPLALCAPGSRAAVAYAALWREIREKATHVAAE